MKKLIYGLYIGMLGACPTATAQTSTRVAMAEIPTGTFWMGSNGYREDFDEAPIHRVDIAHPFRMAITEVTNVQYERFDPAHKALRGKSGFSSADDEAVVFVSWDEAMAYCRWLSEQEGSTYRLPTEAEWEYACRAGSATPYNIGGKLPDVMQKNQAGRDSFKPVSLTVKNGKPNAWGLYDMHGNVEEWCLDWYGSYTEASATDPAGAPDGEFRVTRGGSHGTPVRYLRSANRSAMLPADKHFYTGFRVVQADYPAAWDRSAMAAIPNTGMKSNPSSRPNYAAAAFAGRYALGLTPTERIPAMQSIPQKKQVWTKPSATPFFKEPVPFVVAPLAGSGVPFYTHNHQPAVTWCPNGDLLAVWFSTDDEFGREMTVLSSRLPAGESNWTPAEEFYRVPDRNMTGVSLYCDPQTGVIYHMNGVEGAGWWRNLAMVLRTSSDNGATWSRGNLAVPEHTLRNQVIAGMIRTKEGYLVQVCDALPDMEGGSAVHVSRDGGRTWQAPAADIPSLFEEGKTGALIAGIHAGVVQLRNGDLMALGRGNSIADAKGTPRMPMSISKDMGRTWSYSATEFAPIRGGQRLILRRLNEGPLLLVSFTSGTPATTRPEYGMTFNRDGKEYTGYGMFAALSYDDGKTWPVRKQLTDSKLRYMDGGAWTGYFFMDDHRSELRGYLCATQSPDGEIHLLSSRNHYRFNLAWLKK